MIVVFLFFSNEKALSGLSEEGRNGLVERHVSFNHEVLQPSATVLTTRGLQPTTTAITVRPANGELGVSNGPHAETDEALMGFYLVEVASMAEAIELARAYPMPEGLGCIEVRPVMTSWQFAPSVECDASPATIWSVYADVDSWPAWKTDIREATLDGDLATGTHGWLTSTDGTRMRMSVTDAVPERSYTSETEVAPGAYLHLEHELTALENGRSRVTHRLTLPRAALDQLGMEFSPRFNAGMQESLARLSAEATSRQASRRSR